MAILSLRAVAQSHTHMRLSRATITLFSSFSLLMPFQGIQATTFSEKTITPSKSTAVVAPIEDGHVHNLKVQKQQEIIDSVRIFDIKFNQNPIIGNSYKNNSEFTKIFLNTGWAITKRVFQKNTLGHVYLSTTALPSSSLGFLNGVPGSHPISQGKNQVVDIKTTRNHNIQPVSVSSSTLNLRIARTLTPPPSRSNASSSAPLAATISNRSKPSRNLRLPYGDPTRGKTTISSLFGRRPNPFGSGTSFHKGIDLVGNYGTPIFSTGSGKVLISKKKGGYGHYINIRHSNGFQTIYAHLSRRVVKKNQFVAEGQLIGYLGSSGRSTGPHLHYEIHYQGHAINPKRYFFN